MGWNEGRERFQLSATHIELRFLEYLYVEHEWFSVGYFGVNGYLSMWLCDGVNVEAKAFMGKELFVAD